MRITVRKNFFLLNTLLFLTLIAYSQEREQDKFEAPIRLRTDLVVLDAQVIDKKTGRIVGGLKREDFELYEDGVKQYITHFNQGKLPLSIVILLDTSSSMWSFIEQLRKGAMEALEHLAPDDEVALIATASSTKLIQNFTKNRRLMVEKIRTLNERALGDDGILLHEAIYQAAAHLRKSSNPDGRRVIVVVTDDMSTQFSPSQGHSKEEALHELFETGGVVCGLLGGEYYLMAQLYKQKKAKWYNPIDLLSTKLSNRIIKSLMERRGSVSTYTDETGGLAIALKNEETDTRLADLILQIRNRYSFGYVPSNPRLDGKFRKLKLELSPAAKKKREGKFVVKTRRGYIAPKGRAEKAETQEKR